MRPILRPGTAVFPFGRTVWPFKEERDSGLSAEQMVPVRFSGIFHGYVSPDALEYMAGFSRGTGFKAGSYPSLDFPGAVALGLQREYGSMDGPVCLRVLQRDADIHDFGDWNHGSV